MFQLKLSGVVFVVLAVVIGFAYFSLSNSVSQSVLWGEAEQSHVAQRSLATLARTAEVALQARVEPLVEDAQLVEILSDLRTRTVEAGGVNELKQRVTGNWNHAIFNHLMTWANGYEQELRRRYGNFDSRDRVASHRAALERDPIDWWGARPDTLLAFISMPLKGNRTALVLAAHVKAGQELSGGRDFANDLPLVARAEAEGVPQTGVIVWDSNVFVAVAAPVQDLSGQIVGVVLLGYQLGGALADRFAGVLSPNQHVVFYYADPYFSGGDAPKGVAADAKSERRLYSDEGAAALRDRLLTAESVPLIIRGDKVSEEAQRVAFGELRPRQVYRAELEGKNYLLQRVPWLNDAIPQAGFIVVSDLDAAMRSVSSLSLHLPLLGFLALFFAVIAILVLVRAYTKPLEEIDVGLQEILAGNKEYVFRPRDGHRLQSALGNSLNQVTAFLQGKTSSAESDQAWDALMVDLEPERPSVYGMQAVAAANPVTESEERDKLNALYKDYMEKREALGQHVDMDFDRFCRRIKRNETTLREKHKCKAIEFSVAVVDDKVVLKPTPVFE